jgi:2-(1,2-epoxy-1,2-dihydrophenyl)acetyl-CoA isomerase
VSYNPVPGLGVGLDVSGILRLEIDQPGKRNALSDSIVTNMTDAIDLAGRDEAVRAILLTGAGDHFCSGFDIVSRNAAGTEPRPRVGSIQRRLPSQAHRLIERIMSVQTPVVCRVQGWCAGIGLHLALAADFTVASDDANLWEPFSERGFTPDSGGTWLLPRRVGEVRAREMLMLGRRLNGAEAAEWGLVHRSVPAAELDDTVIELVSGLAAGPTVTLGLTKWLLHDASTDSLNNHLHSEALAMELSSRSEDFREGLAAFKDKRLPRFSGR